MPNISVQIMKGIESYLQLRRSVVHAPLPAALGAGVGSLPHTCVLLCVCTDADGSVTDTRVFARVCIKLVS